MPSLLTQKDFRAVQNLPFCYLCGKYYVPADKPNRDHLPAQCIFLPPDREPLWLPTHVDCNSGESLTDEKIGQLVALRYGKVPTDVEDRRLNVQWFPKEQLAALTNLDVDGAVWRWVRGCHAALYGEPFVGDFSTGYPGALVTPFPRAPKNSERADIEPVKPQHLTFVKTIKLNRALRNLDRVCSNKGKFVYECVWHQAEMTGRGFAYLQLISTTGRTWAALGINRPGVALGSICFRTGMYPTSQRGGARPQSSFRTSTHSTPSGREPVDFRTLGTCP